MWTWHITIMIRVPFRSQFNIVVTVEPHTLGNISIEEPKLV